jgi:UDP-N-acetylmuramoyl-tripeptide--D-alanyl-D-alanine ligase
MEISTLPRGIQLIDDTYNANPGSVAVAVETLCSLKGNGRGILVIGDMMELGQHTQKAHKQIGTLAARAGMAGLYAIGNFAEIVADSAAKAGMDPGKIFIGTKEQIVEAVKVHSGPGDWVLVKGSRLMAMEKVVEGLQSI